MKISHLVFAVIFLAGCSSVQYKDPDKAKGQSGWGYYEINATTEKMVDSMFNYLKSDWAKECLIQVKKVRVKTSDHDIKPKMLENAIVTNLIKKKIAIHSDQFFKDTLKEIEKGQTGLIDPNYAIPVGELQSPNMFLSGLIETNTSGVDRDETISIDVTFTLQEIKTGRILWQDQKRFLKEVKRSGISY